MSLLEIDDLAVVYRTPHGDIDAVRRVSLSIDAGETVDMLGD